jgi:dTDP-4-amino-4,6-dideoxygalactose transaminase
MSKNKPAIEGGPPIRDDNFIVFGAPDIRQEEIDGVVDVLKSGWLSTGPKTKEFEEKFSAYNNMKYGVGTNSCTAALHLCLDVLDLPADSEVITTDMSFVATSNAIYHAGLIPVLVDCERDTQCIDPNEIEKHITDKTKAIVVVHFAGLPCDMDRIVDIAKRYSLYIISDAAHAIETRYKEKSVAEYSDLTAYSFYATKNICVGEGGMVLTNNEDFASKIRMRALHGMSKNAHIRYGSGGFKHYSVDVLGYKYNMLDITAVMGITQLDRVGQSWQRRKEVWDRYSRELAGLPVILNSYGKDIKHGHHLYTVHLDLDKLRVDRDFVLNALIAENIGTGVHYKSIHEHQYYRQTFGWDPNRFKNSKWISDRTLSLPLSSKLQDKDVDDIINALKKILEYYKR